MMACGGCRPKPGGGHLVMTCGGCRADSGGGNLVVRNRGDDISLGGGCSRGALIPRWVRERL